MARAIEELLDALEAARRTDPERGQAYAAGIGGAGALAAMPLVHRTGKRGSLASMFETRRLTVPSRQSAAEIAIGRPPGVYFFAGRASYPHGDVALVYALRGDGEKERESTDDWRALTRGRFTPFDSGGVSTGNAWRNNPPFPLERWRVVNENEGCGRDLGRFLPDYCASHFDDARDYCAPRARPRFAPFHGLSGDDERCWAVEVVATEDIPLSKTAGLACIVVRQGVAEEIPDELQELVLEVEEHRELEAIVYDVVRRHV